MNYIKIYTQLDYNKAIRLGIFGGGFNYFTPRLVLIRVDYADIWYIVNY